MAKVFVKFALQAKKHYQSKTDEDVSVNETVEGLEDAKRESGTRLVTCYLIDILLSLCDEGRLCSLDYPLAPSLLWQGL